MPGQSHHHPDATHGGEPESPGPVPRDPPPTEDMPEEVKEPSPSPEDQGREGAEKDGELQEPPD